MLTEDDWWYLAGLPGEVREQNLLGVHSAPGDPLTRLERAEQFRSEAEALVESDAGVSVCFTGHTHRQEIVVVTPDGMVQRSRGLDADLPRDATCFVNPGTVGQPRDHDPRAAYALFACDTRRVSFRRVAYDRAPLLRQNRKVGLLPPSKLRRVAARVLGLPRL